MPKQWLSLPEAIELTGGAPETARAKLLEGGQAGEIAGRLRGPRGQVKAMTSHQWYWPISWERSELSVQQPVRPPSELDLIIRDRAPAKDLEAVLRAELLLEQMKYGAVMVTHWFWERIEVERETLLHYVAPDPLLRPSSPASSPALLRTHRAAKPEGLEDWYKDVRAGYSSRDQDLVAARAHFRRSWTKDWQDLRALRAQHAPAEWRAPGRKSGVE